MCIRDSVFGEGAGCYDQTPELAFGLMYHGITYADEAYSDDTRGRMSVRFWYPVMRQGVIAFDRPEQCPITRPVREMECKPFGAALENFIGADVYKRQLSTVSSTGFSGNGTMGESGKVVDARRRAGSARYT